MDKDIKERVLKTISFWWGCFVMSYKGSYTTTNDLVSWFGGIGVLFIAVLAVLNLKLGDKSLEQAYPQIFHFINNTALVLFVGWVTVFVIRFLYTPAKIHTEQEDEIKHLKGLLDTREEQQKALNMLWDLRKEGVSLRNNDIPVNNNADFAEWVTKFTKWRDNILKAAQIVSPNLKGWLETLNTRRPYPSDLTPFNDEHARLMSIMSEIIARLEVRLIRDLYVER